MSHSPVDLEACGIPLSERSLLALLGSSGRIAALAPVGQRSRNRLFRLSLTDGEPRSCILKLVRRDADPFWEHHLRREHWLLQLLQRCWPGGAPRPLGAAFGLDWGLLLSEDVGDQALAEVLSANPAAAAGAERIALLKATAERLVDLHAILRQHDRPFRNVCQSVVLDRLTTTSLLRRLRVARQRLATGEGAPLPLPRAVAERYRAVVIRPLLRGQRQMIHNSLSPLNVVLGDRPRFIDWETMADAAPEFDVAELLRYPAVGLTWRETDALVGGLFGAAIDGERLRLAALSRAIDYAGANAQQWRRSQQQGDDAFAGLAYRRLRWYLAEAAVLTNQLRLESVMADILRDPGT